MGRSKLSLASLADLDLGKVDVAFRATLQHILADLKNRPAEKKDRSITVKVVFSPEEITAGSLDTVCVSFEISAKVPGLRSRMYSMLAGKDGLTFDAESLDDAKQLTFEPPDKQVHRKKGDQ